MAHAHVQVWIHYVWSVKDREAVLIPTVRGPMLQHVRQYAAEERMVLDTINAVEDHVHCLMALEARSVICDVVGRIKGESSHWINAERLTKKPFSWQDGYSAQSVSPQNLDRVRQYIRDQEKHHRGRELKVELEVFVAEDWGDGLGGNGGVGEAARVR